jgi:hypothetical protein
LGVLFASCSFSFLYLYLSVSLLSPRRSICRGQLPHLWLIFLSKFGHRPGHKQWGQGKTDEAAERRETEWERKGAILAARKREKEQC